MSRLNLVPARGRDYKVKAAVQAAFYSGADFIVADMSSRYDGKPANVDDLRAAGINEVNVRYDGLRKVVVLPVADPMR